MKRGNEVERLLLPVHSHGFQAWSAPGGVAGLNQTRCPELEQSAYI